MSTVDELNESLDNQDEQDAKLLEIIKKLNLVASRMEERQIERNAKRNFINTVPSDYLAEYGPKLLRLERDDEEKIKIDLVGLVASTQTVLSDIDDSTGGTASPYISGAYSYANSVNSSPPWFNNALQPFIDLAEYKLQRKDIPIRVEKLSTGLGDMFSAALQSVDKARVEIGHQSDCIMAMRNFLQKSFWGSLLQFAKQTKPSIWRNFQKSRLKDPDTRDLVAKSFSNSPSDERKMVELLNNMFDLTQEMSEVGKNLSFDDLTLLDTFFARWILVIDEILKKCFSFHRDE